ncbi:protein tramtrack, beta isoform-like isoform X2 [Amphibalanus amphitrite]|nr:protein tramtrack, beta isoform-like isoform X2 [Amphibalanus amphitrite]XP_043236163.1 protein tramtrack, beta isoform-like isoform X2 [Amphibalanus amphitrite]XP_043236164.1 protein tramtrack, beta isoform-like isoform X2 [Amphibalanus amphitrite]XP_043236165.1 protein tramtrack, beta isoform-like isoform X2 [Amphibalanus amphitrite]XP_043236166.1 protein tramtrack, beta isoform-like isoform X2 [Amphibalanus amphitrite]XP_043236167.1 protein tramtrack, beta isoform-like isoform X2 [Amphib
MKMDAATQKFCLQWNDFKGIVTSALYSLRNDEDFVDVTLCCEGRQIKAHRMMLSACSPYFKEVLKGNPCQHPVFFLKDVSYFDISSIIEFIYTGEVNVGQSNLSSFLKTAEMLQVKGLANQDKEEVTRSAQQGVRSTTERTAAFTSPARPSAAPSKRHTSTGDPLASPSAGKRVRVEPAAGGRVMPPPAGDHGRVVTTEWLVHTQPPPAAVPSASPAGHHSVAVKRESAAPEDGSGAGSALEANNDYSGTMDFEVSHHSFDGGPEDALGSQSGTYYGDDGSLGAAEEAWTMDPGVLSALTPRTSSVASRRPVACRYCGKTYLHRQSLFNHVQMHLGKTRCTVCGETLSTVITLRNHMRTQHPLNDGEMTAAGEGSSSERQAMAAGGGPPSERQAMAAGDGLHYERQAMAAGGGPPSERQVPGSCAVLSDGSDKCQS